MPGRQLDSLGLAIPGTGPKRPDTRTAGAPAEGIVAEWSARTESVVCARAPCYGS
jgi:hypothetical protein